MQSDAAPSSQSLSPNQDDSHDYSFELIAFIDGDPSARATFPLHVADVLRRMARNSAARFAPHLAPDQVDEIPQRVLELLLTKAHGAFDPNRGSAFTYLKLITSAATLDVGADYPMPGERTRPSRSQDGSYKIRRPAVSLDVASESAERLESDLAQQEIDAVLDELTAKWILDEASSTGSAPVPSILTDIHGGLGFSTACSRAGVSRFAGRRAVRRWAHHVDLESKLFQ